MTKVISAFEAPALLDLHPTLTRYALYERLTGQPETRGPIGLAAMLADGVMRFAQDEYGWETPVSKPFSGNSTDGSIEMQARAYVTRDREGPLLVVFLHLADYLHRASWGKSGVPPQAFIAQANWTMHLAAQNRLAYLVLSDKRVVLYEIQRDEDVVKRLLTGLDEMATAIATQTPPPVDAAPQSLTPAAPVADSDAKPADLNELVRRFRITREVKAETSNSATFAEQAAEAAANALKAALPKGSSHELEGVRIHHNAKTGRLTEEKIDAAYF